MKLDLNGLLPGFADPSRDSQIVFRRVMDATARPGTVATLDRPTTLPPGIGRAAGAVLLALVDQDTALWLDPALRGGDAQAWLRFHCGCPVTEAMDKAAFALTAQGTPLPDLGAFNQGDARYPDQAATVLIQASALSGGLEVGLTGPGIEAERIIAALGLGESFWEARAGLVAHFQFGIDIMLCAGDSLVCLPRTTRTTIKGT